LALFGGVVEIVEYVRNAHNQLRGVKGAGGLLKLQQIDFPQVNVVPNIITIPMLTAGEIMSHRYDDTK